MNCLFHESNPECFEVVVGLLLGPELGKTLKKTGRVERQELNQGMLGASIKILLLERVSAHKMD